jgi:hypothetical protein
MIPATNHPPVKTKLLSRKTPDPSLFPRTEGEIREEMLTKGSFFLEFLPLKKSQVADQAFYARAVEQWRALEHKSLLVSKEGCLFPYDTYRVTCTASTAHLVRCDRRAVHFFSR